MGEISEGLMRRLAKLKELAERGVDGEKETASAMLANLLAKHGLTMEDLDGRPARSWVEVSFNGKHENVLLDQIIRKVTQQNVFYIRKPYKARGRFKVELTPAEHVEIEFMFNVLRKALEKEMEKVVAAFVHVHDLFGPRKERSDDEKEPELTPEQRADARQIAMMSMGMSKVDLKRAIK